VPSEGSIVSLINHKFSTDTFDFDVVTNSFRYLRSATVYSNTTSGIDALLTASSLASPIQEEGEIDFATFTMPSGTSTDNNLYLIWDYRTISQRILCQDTSATADLGQYNSCCTCATPAVNQNVCGPDPVWEDTVLGGISYPKQIVFNIGSATGTVIVEFTAQSVPDRMIVYYDGAVVIDTQYVGATQDITYPGSGLTSNYLSSALSGNNPDTGTPFVEPISGQAYEPNGNAPLPTVENGGFVAEIDGVTTDSTWHRYSFTKSTASTSVTVKIYAPLSTTGWGVKVACVT
jgi:hypothetical protein